MHGQNFFALDVTDGYGKKIAFTIGAKQGRGLYRVGMFEFARFQVDGDLAFIGGFQQTAASPQRHEPGFFRIPGLADPLAIIAILDQAVETNRSEAVSV
jgi:hypothetical protein